MNEHISELYEEANRLFEEGKYHNAEPLLKDVYKVNPYYADVLNKLGVISHLKGELEEAVNYFEEALHINPQYTEASLNLAITYNDLGEFSKAQEIFSLAAQVAHPAPGALDPFAAGKLANEHFRIGNIYLDFGLYDDAIDEYRKAIKLSQRFPDVHTKLGVALRNKGLYEDAIIHFNAAKEINPGYGQAWIQLGLTYYMKGLSGLAVEEWENALEMNPDLKEAKNYLQLIKKEET
ncbi:TPR repeat-containing protein YrrB [bacterium BMS3Bbin06]|nr:TPR repeat-containing protein YrrB [bacterium BMS3Abin08]GBE35095.1 TPR repeat-containing protein YrrB [bacterium BMS3Bbin06]HDO35072.1 tetratricopeptide repeat protein [Nitrospirota bacterium]HDY71225.1 tetratricopeptide repeat protein [Nitrospirota bacterium]